MDQLLRHPFDDGLGTIEIAPVEDPDPVPVTRIENTRNVCSTCEIPLVISIAGGLQCNKCGFTDDSEAYAAELSNENAVEQYNTSDASTMVTKIVASGSEGARIIHSSSGTGNGRAAQLREIIKQITGILNRHGNKIINNQIISEAAELFAQLAQHRVLRGNVRKGTQAACTVRVCPHNNVILSQKQAAELFGVTQSEVSNGDKILADLAASGLIVIPTTEDRSEESQTQRTMQDYFYKLGLKKLCEAANLDPAQVNEFCCKLVKFTTKYCIADSSTLNSKCVGAISLYIKYSSLSVNLDTIESECKISKTTFARFEKAVQGVLNDPNPNVKRSRLRRLFQDYKLIEKPRAAPPSPPVQNEPEELAELEELEDPGF